MLKAKKTECKIDELPENITRLKVLTEQLRMARHMNIHKGGSEWIEVITPMGKAFIRGLLKKDAVAVSDNYASEGTEYPMHQHPGHEVFIVYKGSIILNVGGKEVVIKNKPYYFNASKKHSAFFAEETQFIAITVPADLDWPSGG